MTMTTSQAIDAVETGLSELILITLKGAAREQYFPCSNPDEMDDKIAAGKQYAERLRKLRTEFEDTITGVIW